MSFLAPIAFLFAATLPVVVVFYLLKRKRVVRLVPSTVLWQKFLAENQASAPFQKLRRNWIGHGRRTRTSLLKAGDVQDGHLATPSAPTSGRRPGTGSFSLNVIMRN